jgi:hypothetical protein
VPDRIASRSANRHAERVNRSLRAGAIAAVSIAAVQTVLDAITSLLSVASFVLTAVTLAAVLLRRIPLVIMWLVLAADLVQVVRYASAFDNPLGGLLYGTLLLPFVFRTVAMILALLARRSRRTTSDVTPGPMMAAAP